MSAKAEAAAWTADRAGEWADRSSARAMRKVLVLAYRFPPQGGAGVQRTLKFVKYLPQAQSYVDITSYMSVKMESIAANKSQVRANGDLWIQGVKGRAMYRGCQINVEFAESFEVVKAVDVYFTAWDRGRRARPEVRV